MDKMEKKSKLRVFLAKKLTPYPKLKQFGAECLMRLKYLRYGIYKSKCISDYQVNDIKSLLPSKWKKAELFFGYYDKPSENRAGYVLVNASLKRRTYKLPKATCSIHVLVVNKNDVGSNPLLDIETFTYNWQQGCRAQWLDDDLFIMNEYDDLRQIYISKVYSVKQGKEIKRFDKPVQDSYHKDYLLSINYQRLLALRPDYCYRNLQMPTKDMLRKIDNDGIWTVDFNTGKSRLLYSLKELAEFEPNDYPKNALHKVNVLMISPNGERFIMIHRYLVDGRRYDRLLLGDKEGNSLKMLANNEMVSHPSWVNNDTSIAYLRSPEGIDAYYYINVDTVTYTKVEIPLFNQYGDGHPSKYGDILISDSGTDDILHRHVIYHNYKVHKSVNIASVYQPVRFRLQCRCDPHPRFSMDGNTVYFDAIFTGRRSMYYINLHTIEN